MQRPFSGYTGRGVRVAIIDSGVNPAHPHVGGVAGGIRIGAGGPDSSDFLDYNGHGTAVAGAIREKAPDALLYAVKVFDRTLTTRMERIIGAIEWCVEQDMMVINLSLGTSNAAHRDEIKRVVALAATRDITIVSARNAAGQPLLPGCLPSVVAVELDWECPRGRFKTTCVAGEPVFIASAYPREMPGVSPERNLNGISFAVANMTGFVALAREMRPDASVQSLKQLLMKTATAE